MAESKLVARDEDLFGFASLTPVYPLVTAVTMGLIKVYRLPMDKDRVYIADMGFNDVFIYSVGEARHWDKYFWKLNLVGNPVPRVQSVLSAFEILVEITDIPSFDPRFDQQRGGWVTMRYDIRVQVTTSPAQIGQLHSAVNPVTAVRNAVRRAARDTLPFMRYEEALIAAAEEDIQQRVMTDPKIQETGLSVHSVDVEGVEGSKKLAEGLAASFDSLRQANDRVETARLFESLDKDVFQRMLEGTAPGEKALEFRARAANQVLEAFLASGYTMQDVLRVSSQAASLVGQRNSLPEQITVMALNQLEDKDISVPQIPQGVSHQERLKWERQLVDDRVPNQLQDSGGHLDIFTFLLENGDELKVTWWSPEKPPEVLINGRDRGSDYVSLRPGYYDYNRTTVWDLYWQTRRLLGVAGNEAAAN